MNATCKLCPQCLMSNTIGCTEMRCPGDAQFVERATLLPTAKTCHAMGQRIERLETLIVRAGNWLAGDESGATGIKSEIMDEALRICGKKKTGGAN